MRGVRGALASGLLVLAISGPAYAAPGPWSAPSDVGPPGNGGDVWGLGFSASGTGLLGWRSTGSFIAPLNAVGTASSAVRLPHTLAAGPAVERSGRGTVLLESPAGPKDVSRIIAAAISPTGALGPLQTLGTAHFLAEVALAVDPRGDAIAAWTEQLTPPNGPRTGAYRTRVAWRPAGGSFGKPTTLFQTPSTSDGNPLAVAIGRDGRAIVVEANGRMLRARVGTRRRGFGPPMTVGPQGTLTRSTAAVADSGRIIVAWGTQRAGINADSPWIVRAAQLAPTARRFAAAQTLDPGNARRFPEGRLGLAFASDGRATLAWSAVGAYPTYPVMAAIARPSHRFAAPQQLAPSGAVGDVDVRADGAAIVVWDTLAGPQEPTQVFAAVKRATAAKFAAAEPVGVPEDARLPRVAFNTITGQPTTSWNGRPDPTPPNPNNTSPSAIRVATRAAQGLTS